MTQWIARGLLVGASFFAASAYATEETYELQLQVERNGTVVVDTAADVIFGVDADLRVVEENHDASLADSSQSSANTGESVRVIVEMNPADETSKNVAIRLQYFEKQRGGWLLVGEPSLISAPGEKSTVQFSNDIANSAGTFDNYKIAVAVGKKSQNRQKQSDLDLRTDGCAMTNGEIQPNESAIASVFVPDGADPKCCSTKSMTCCNATHCCDNWPGHGECCGDK
ncbi:MAG: hypothetical protein ABJB01_01255 [Rudaea sp.]